jgi:uncharacterized membrane protein
MILLCVIGIGLGFGLFLNRPWITLTVGPWLVTTCFFLTESLVPLGKPGMLLGVALTVAAAWLLLEAAKITTCLDKYLDSERLSAWRKSYALWSIEQWSPENTWAIRRFSWIRKLCLGKKLHYLRPLQFGKICLVLMGAFMYAAMWRFPFPSIDGSSEKIPDLMYITSYMAGTGIPAKDYWCAPYASIQYYSFQHYAASLLGRSFGISPGLTYNYAICLLMALIVTTGIGVICTISRLSWVRILCSAALVVGGSGVSGIIHFLLKDVTLWSSMRFIGSVQCDVSPVGIWINSYSARYPRMQLPGEPLSYSIYLGDYHAPLAGLYLLFVAVLVLSQYHLLPGKDNNVLLAIAGATIPWCLVSNTWSMPLQGLLVGSWTLFQLVNRSINKQQIAALLLGGIIILFSLLSYLSKFIPATSGYNATMKLVAMSEHTPPLLLVLFLFPVVVSCSLGIFCRNTSVAWAALFWVGIFAFCEFVYIDDVYSGQYDRFNSTLKWWPWLQAGVTCSLAPLVLSYSRRFWIKCIVAAAIGYPCFFVVDLARYWWNCPKIAQGVLTGDAFITSNPEANSLYSHLKELPVGLTIERPEGASFTNTTALSIMAGKPCWLGWLGHEQLWRGYSPELAQRSDKIIAFYSGKSSEVEWLWANHIKYILWFKQQDVEPQRITLSTLLMDHYTWVETFKTAGRSTGYWELKQ